MNILMANWSWYPSGGDWTAIQNITRLYERNRHHIVPFSMHDARNYPTPYDKYFVRQIDYNALNKNKSLMNGVRVLTHAIYSFEAKHNIERLLHHTRIDIAHFHNLGPHITPSIVASFKRRGIPVVWTLHDFGLLCPAANFVSGGKICEECGGGRYYRCVVNRCKKGSYSASMIACLRAYVHGLLSCNSQVDVFVCPSRFLYNKFLAAGFMDDKLALIPSPFELDSLAAVDTPILVNEAPYILYHGRLERIKGIFALLKAQSRMDGIKLVIAGTGSEETACKEYVREHNIRNVVFLGHLDGPSVHALIHRCAFAVCPSECYENMPYSIIEAMALGKPVIGSRIGGIPELVIDHSTGLTFECGNVQELCDSMRYMRDHPEIGVQFGRAGKSHIMRLVDPETHYQKMVELFTRLGVN